MPSLVLDHWAQLVRDFKDSERAYDRTLRESELLALAIVDWIQYTHIRQWNLFVQKRGEEYDRLKAHIEERGQDLEAFQRFVDDEERWHVSLELAER